MKSYILEIPVYTYGEDGNLITLRFNNLHEAAGLKRRCQRAYGYRQSPNWDSDGEIANFVFAVEKEIGFETSAFGFIDGMARVYEKVLIND